jgi:hypothetical protein
MGSASPPGQITRNSVTSSSQPEPILGITKLGGQDYGELVRDALAHLDRQLHQRVDFVAGQGVRAVMRMEELEQARRRSSAKISAM